ncbi:hypothetical protein C1645_795445 [Glomus cerebriforme]|uniref:Uncharacterized protein n=1 Tax=Glomus cerebriforme TaxID=658196 RepID=A0A397S8X1_9GLOM|nr:hypothetical protein C1645_795445 [Glomus cerebriforme]
MIIIMVLIGNITVYPYLLEKMLNNKNQQEEKLLWIREDLVWLILLSFMVKILLWIIVIWILYLISINKYKKKLKL